jgi:hypothetical protein
MAVIIQAAVVLVDTRLQNPWLETACSSETSYPPTYCDVHAVGLTGQQRKNAFLGNGWTCNNGCFFWVCSEEVFSLRSVPRLHNPDTSQKSAVESSLDLELLKSSEVRES